MRLSARTLRLRNCSSDAVCQAAVTNSADSVSLRRCSRLLRNTTMKEPSKGAPECALAGLVGFS